MYEHELCYVVANMTLGPIYTLKYKLKYKSPQSGTKWNMQSVNE